MANFLVLNGPNLNLLGSRSPDYYGDKSLDEIHQLMHCLAQTHGHHLVSYQSNSEGKLIDYLHNSTEDIDFIIINPAGLTHTSVALLDALLATQLPFIEVHLSNIFNREAFRSRSFFSADAVGVVSGFKHESYLLALQAGISHITH